MVKFKKALSIALVTCMAGSMFAGCNSSSTTETTTAAEEEKKDETTAAETTEAETETETKAEEDADASAAEDMVNMISGMADSIEENKGYRVESEITFDSSEETEDESSSFSGDFQVVGEVDGNGNAHVAIAVSMDEDTDDIEFDGEILELYSVDGVVYVDASPVYDILADYIDEDTISQYEDAFGVTDEEVQKLLTLQVPVSTDSLELSDDAVDAAKSIVELVEDDITDALSKGDYVTKDGDSYTLTLNSGDNLGQLAIDVMNALDGNIGDIYDAYIDFMKKTDYASIVDDVMAQVKDAVIDYVEKNSDEELTDEQKEEIESELNETVEEAKASIDEAIEELEDGKDDVMDEWDSMMDELADYDADELKKEMEDEGIEFAEVYTITKTDDGYTVSSAMNMSVDNDEVTASEEVSINSTITFTDDIEITAPEGFTELDEYIDIASKIFEKYQEMMAQYDDDDDDDDYDDDDDDDYTSDVPSQEDLAAQYGVTLKDGQVILTEEDVEGAIIVSAPEGITLEANDLFAEACSGQDEEYDKSINVFIFDSEYDQDYVEEYEEEYTTVNDKYSYAVSDYDIEFYYFADNFTASISLTFWEEDDMDDAKAAIDDDAAAYFDQYAALFEYVDAPSES